MDYGCPLLVSVFGSKKATEMIEERSHCREDIKKIKKLLECIAIHMASSKESDVVDFIVDGEKICEYIGGELIWK